MKQLIFIISLLGLVFWNLSCTKETIDKPINQPTALKSYSTSDFDDITIGRDGVYAPFMSPYTIVRYDVFTKMLYVYNISGIDSVLFTRVSTSISVYLGVSFNLYEVIVSHTNGSLSSFKSLCPSYLGTKSVVIPDVDYNQLDNSNNNFWVNIQRTNRRTSEYNTKCGDLKWKWFYNIQDYSGTNVVQQIEGLCDLSLNYKLIL